MRARRARTRLHTTLSKACLIYTVALTHVSQRTYTGVYNFLIQGWVRNVTSTRTIAPYRSCYGSSRSPLPNPTLTSKTYKPLCTAHLEQYVRAAVQVQETLEEAPCRRIRALAQENKGGAKSTEHLPTLVQTKTSRKNGRTEGRWASVAWKPSSPWIIDHNTETLHA